MSSITTTMRTAMCIVGTVIATCALAQRAPEPTAWELSTGRWTASTATQAQAPRQAAATISGPQRLAGGTTYDYFARLTEYGGETAWGGTFITVTTGTSGTSATIKGLFASANVMTATIDGGTVSIEPQVVYNHSTYGDVWLCQVDTAAMTYSTTTPITGTLSADGTIELGPCGLFLTSGTYKGGNFGVWSAAEMHCANATMTNQYHTGDSTEVYPVFIEQTYDNQITVVNFANNARAMVAYVDPDSTIEMPQQVAYTTASYGDFVCCPADWSKSSSAQSGSLYLTATDTQLTLGNWGIFCRLYSSLCPYGYNSSTIVFGDGTGTLGAFSLRYPTPKTLVWDGDGSEQNPYLLTTSEQVLAFAESVNYGNTYAGKHIALGADIDLGQITQAYRAIGRSEERPFSGSFDGRGHTLSNLTVVTGDEPYTGIFGYASQGSSFKDVNVTGLTLKSYGQYAGGLVASSYGDITGVHVTGATIDHSNSYGGGVAGACYSSEVSDCTFSGTLSGMGSTGGIVGMGKGAHVHDCQVDANITFSGYYNRFYRGVGGIVGNSLDAASQGVVTNKGIVEDCIVEGTFTDTDGHCVMGGIVGNLNGGEVRRCLNVAPISARVNNTYNGIVGGIVGLTYGSTVTDCVSANEVVNSVSTDATQVGGIVGYLLDDDGSPTTVTHCLSTGQVVLSTATGREALYGINYKSQLSDCLYDKQINGQDVIDSLAYMGKTTAELTSGEALDGFSTDVWTFTAGLYPQLKMAVGTKASALAAAPLTLKAGETTTRVKNDFAVSTQGGVSWWVYDSSKGLVTDCDALTIADSVVTLKNVSASVLMAATTDATKHFKFINLSTLSSAGFVGQGTEEDPYQISSKADLIALNNAVTKKAQSFTGDYFVQTCDIDLEYATDFHGVGCDGNQNHTFDGTYDGSGHAIHRLLIDSVAFDASGKVQAYGSAKTAGFFGYCNKNSVIKNLTIASDCVINGYQVTGSIAAVTLGRIENCRNYAPVTCYDDYVGGIVAQTVTGSVVTGCYNGGNVTSGSANVGGITAIAAGTITWCQNDGQVTSTTLSQSRYSNSQSTAGGIAASISGSKAVVTDNVNTGAVSAPSIVGGITTSVVSGAQMRRNLNYGMVSYSDDDATVGAIAAGKITNTTYNSANYYDKQMTTYSATAMSESDACIGALTSELTNGEPLDSLDASSYDWAAGQYPVLKAFKDEPAAVAHRLMVMQLPNSQTIDNVRTRANLAKTDSLQWTLTTGADYSITTTGQYHSLTVTLRADTTSLRDVLTATYKGYDKVIPLRSIPQIFDGSGTEADPYQIKTVADMLTLSRFSNDESYNFAGQYLKVMNDIDFTDTENFTPVANGGQAFAANFDGGGHTLKGLRIDHSDDNYQALFGNYGEGWLHDLTLTDATIVGSRYVAGFVGRFGGRGTNLTFNGQVSTPKNPYAGGIVAQLQSGASLTGCVNHGEIMPEGGYAAGIACFVSSGSTVDSCSNDAYISGTCVSGIAYSCNGTVQNCLNTGNMSGSSTAGIAGVVGGTLLNCRNEGTIASERNYAGGIVGRSQITSQSTPIIISNCHNVAPVSGNEDVGGFASYLQGSYVVTDCSNTGTVTGTNNCGGLVGQVYNSSGSNSTFTRCHNSGTVTSTGNYAGGLVGRLSNYLQFDSCHNTGAVTSTGHYVGGLFGNTRTITANDCWNSGNVEADGYAVGGVAGYSQGNFYRCANVGNVTSTSGTGNTGKYGNAGGIVGQSLADIYDCYNMGTVTGPSLTGGLIGLAYYSSATIHRSYNAGQVVSADGQPSPIQGVGAYTTSVLDSAYYDADIFTGTPGTADAAAVGLTTRQLTLCDTLGQAFTLSQGFYPRLATLTADTLLNYWAATPVLAEGDVATSVTKPFSIGMPDGTTWTLSSNLQCVDGTVYTLALGEATLTKTCGQLSRTYTLNVTKVSGIETVATDAQVASTTWVDLQGRRMAQPAAGGVYVKLTMWSNGTTTAQKVLVK